MKNVVGIGRVSKVEGSNFLEILPHGHLTVALNCPKKRSLMKDLFLFSYIS